MELGKKAQLRHQRYLHTTVSAENHESTMRALKALMGDENMDVMVYSFCQTWDDRSLYGLRLLLLGVGRLCWGLGTSAACVAEHCARRRVRPSSSGSTRGCSAGPKDRKRRGRAGRAGPPRALQVALCRFGHLTGGKGDKERWRAAPTPARGGRPPPLPSLPFTPLRVAPT